MLDMTEKCSVHRWSTKVTDKDKRSTLPELRDTKSYKYLENLRKLRRVRVYAKTHNTRFPTYLPVAPSDKDATYLLTEFLITPGLFYIVKYFCLDIIIFHCSVAGLNDGFSWFSFNPLHLDGHSCPRSNSFDLGWNTKGIGLNKMMKCRHYTVSPM